MSQPKRAAQRSIRRHLLAGVALVGFLVIGVATRGYDNGPASSFWLSN